MDASVQKSSCGLSFRPAACRGSLPTMTDVTHTPHALRWVVLFLAACAVLGLFLGFRDQIRKNPPGWYTGAEQIATPLAPVADGAREAVAFDPAAGSDATATPVTVPSPKVETPAAAPAETTDTPATKPSVPPASRPKPDSPSAPKSQAPADPVGDILEGQKQTEPAAPPVPY